MFLVFKKFSTSFSEAQRITSSDLSLLIPPIFPANSGNKEITWMMLEAGAETDVVNSVGRTAAQMAAFVGKILSFPKLPKKSCVRF